MENAFYIGNELFSHRGEASLNISSQAFKFFFTFFKKSSDFLLGVELIADVQDTGGGLRF